MINLDAKLENIISGFLDKTLRSKQITISRNIESLNNIIRNDKVTIGAIVETINKNNNLNITIESFKLMIHRARLQQKNESIKQEVIQEKTLTPEIIPKPSINKETQLTKNNDTNDNDIKEIDDKIRDEWIKAFNFLQTLRITPVLYKNIKVLTKAGWTPANYHLLREQLSITTSRKLISVVSVITSSKFRQNIYKDNDICI